MASRSEEYIGFAEMLQLIERRYKGMEGIAQHRAEHLFYVLHQHYISNRTPRFQCIDCKQAMPLDGSTHPKCHSSLAEALREVPGCVAEISKTDLLGITPTQLQFDASNQRLYTELFRDIQQHAMQVL